MAGNYILTARQEIILHAALFRIIELRNKKIFEIIYKCCFDKNNSVLFVKLPLNAVVNNAIKTLLGNKKDSLILTIYFFINS